MIDKLDKLPEAIGDDEATIIARDKVALIIDNETITNRDRLAFLDLLKAANALSTEEVDNE